MREDTGEFRLNNENRMIRSRQRDLGQPSAINTSVESS